MSPPSPPGGRNGHKYSQTVNTKRDQPCLGLQGPGEVEQRGARPGHEAQPSIFSGPSRALDEGHFGNPKASSESATKARSWIQPQTGPSCRDPG